MVILIGGPNGGQLQLLFAGQEAGDPRTAAPGGSSSDFATFQQQATTTSLDGTSNQPACG